MSVYKGKLLELLSVDREANESFLRIRLSFEQDTELRWKIDHETAENLKAVTALGQSHKYRLSFYCSWDPTKNQYVSFLTRTYRDQSDKIYFSCSKTYISGLNAIKCSEQNSQVYTLPFLSIASQPIDHVKQKIVSPKRLYRKSSWIAVAMLVITSAIFWSYSPIYEAKLIENTIVKAKDVDSEVLVDLMAIEEQPINSQIEIDASNEHESSLSISEPKFPTSELNEVISYSIPAGTVALTFDDGPSKYTKEITDILKMYQVGGTFFFIGENVKRYPEYVQYVKSNGYVIGSHSMHHTNLVTLSYQKQKVDLLETNRLIEELIQEEVVLFRPPYGSKNEATVELMNKNQIKMVLWDTDTKDWKSRNADKIVNSVLSAQASGSIILLHESQAVIDALPRIIEYLQAQDLQIVNLK